MIFTSQICTTKEQSERLLALGLKKETADMSILTNRIDCDGIRYSLTPYSEINYPKVFGAIPAWSLHRLMEMCPLIPNPARFLAVASFKSVYVRMNDEMDMCYAGKGTYNNLIDCIQWLIREGYFNKEYLVK